MSKTKNPFISKLLQILTLTSRFRDIDSSINMIKYTLYFMLIGIVTMASCQQDSVVDESQKPADNRFTVSILTEPNSLDEPMAFTFLNDEEMVIIERKGGIKHFNTKTRAMKTAGQLGVNIYYTNKEGESRAAEEGLVGITADPNYELNHWVYLLFAHPEEPKHVLARYELKDGVFYADTEKVLLDYPVQRQECCHTGGGMTWDDQGNLFITTGNNTVNPRAGTSNLDERPGHENNDDQRTAGNTNDLRGKILRIHPEEDGSYSIPEGNLFPQGTEDARAEIYTMGHRNPWRVSWDSQTGYIYWGEVGPDASEDTERGPKGYDEFNRAKGPGFFGWPYFIADNQPYVDFDHVTNSVGDTFDVNNPVNESVNNTGLRELPAPQGALIWYPYSHSEEFPLLGSAGRNATGGPLYRQADFDPTSNRYPTYYDGKWLIVDFMRGWIMSVTLDENSDFASMEPFLPKEKFISAIDMQFGPEGDLYVLEYGSAWFQGNEDALIKRIRYNGGNREPVVRASVDKTAGAVPLTVRLSSEGTLDYDDDELTFQWTITAKDGTTQTLEGPSPTLTLEQAGLYQVELTATDSQGSSNQQAIELLAGNAPPEVSLHINKGNKSFFFAGDTLNYEISISDQEDGSTTDGAIVADDISINFDYVPEGFDPIEVAQNHVAADEWVAFSRGATLISESDCFSCHKMDTSSIGPSYLAIARKYENQPQQIAELGHKIINGSVGIWGDHAMSAHPDISPEEAEQIVDYIMSLNDPALAPEDLPLSGDYITQSPSNEHGKGGFILRAAYQDLGNEGLPSLTGERIIALRNPLVDAESHDFAKDIQLLTSPRRSLYVMAHEGYVGFSQLDLTGISEIVLVAETPGRTNGAGGIIEVRLGSSDGELLGATEFIEAQNLDIRAEIERLTAEWKANGEQGPKPNWRTVRRMNRPAFSIAVNKTTGQHDLYFIVKNPEAQEGQVLLQLHEFRFVTQ